ncbi:MAG: hypothetical protein KA807_09360 [Prolixibacteraceae bacterium]|nr:hypothetical protein [Prolixibacteraceae bacterium]
MKKSLFIILFTLINIYSFSQNEFKSLFESLSVNDRFSNMVNLRHYQSKYPGHAVTYYLIGDILEKYMTETNPLFLFEFIEINYRDAITNYNLCKYKLDEKQARQDREFFGNIEIITDNKKVSLPDILYDLEVRLDRTEKYFNNAKKLHDNYYRCIEKYNESLFKFRDIIERFPDYKGLLLLSDDKLRKEVESIASNFDSSLVYFDVYKKSCSYFPHLIKVNEYKLNPITTYRLEGLVEADFTRPVVELWSFREWVNEFLGILDGDIKYIRNGLFENDKKLDQQIEKLKTENKYDDDLTYFLPEVKFKNLIGKYDYSSLCNKLFDYRSGKVEYLVKSRAEINDPVNISEDVLINRLRYYKDLAFHKESLNKVADSLRQSVTIDDIGKNFEFFETKYRGLDGLKRWCEVEKYDNDKIFSRNLLNLKIFIDKEKVKNVYTDSTTLWKKKNVAMGVQFPDPLTLRKDTLITSHYELFKKRYPVISGYEISKDSSFKSFTSLVDRDGNIKWLNYLDVKTKDTIREITPVFQKILDDSTIYVVNSIIIRKSGMDTRMNSITGYNWNGKTTISKTITGTGYPEYFFADEINESFLLVTKGNNKVDDYDLIDTMTISMCDYSSNRIWENKYLIKGSFVNIVYTNSELFVTLNCNYLKDESGGFGEFKGNTKSIVCLHLSREGKIKAVHKYSDDNDLQCYFSEKVTSNIINLLGETKAEGSFEGEPLYLLIDPDGKIEFSTKKELSYKRLK